MPLTHWRSKVEPSHPNPHEDIFLSPTQVSNQRKSSVMKASQEIIAANKENCNSLQQPV